MNNKDDRFKNLFTEAYDKDVSKTNIDQLRKKLNIDDFYNYMVQQIVSIGENDYMLQMFNLAVSEYPKETLMRRYKMWSQRMSDNATDNLLNMDLSSFSEEAVQSAYEIILKKMMS